MKNIILKAENISDQELRSALKESLSELKEGIKKSIAAASRYHKISLTSRENNRHVL